MSVAVRLSEAMQNCLSNLRRKAVRSHEVGCFKASFGSHTWSPQGLQEVTENKPQGRLYEMEYEFWPFFDWMQGRHSAMAEKYGEQGTPPVLPSNDWEIKQLEPPLKKDGGRGRWEQETAKCGTTLTRMLQQHSATGRFSAPVTVLQTLAKGPLMVS